MVNLLRIKTLYGLRRYRKALLLSMLILFPLVPLACSDGGEQVPIGVARKGQTLIVRIDDIQTLQEIRYQATGLNSASGEILRVDLVDIQRVPEVRYRLPDLSKFSAVPSNVENELVVISVNLSNLSTGDVSVAVGEDSPVLKGIGDNQLISALDLSPGNVDNISMVPESQDQEDPNVLTVSAFTGGPILLPPTSSLAGSVVFEVPKELGPRALDWKAGDDLTVDIDQNHYLIAPSNSGSELIAMNILVHNAESTSAIMTIDEEAAELIVFGTNDVYKPISLRPENEANVKVVQGTHPTENTLVPFLWGPIHTPTATGETRSGLLQDHSVQGWVVFEVPKGTEHRALRWEAGDSVYISSN